MDSIGGFHEVEIDGKPYLVFHLNQPQQVEIPAMDSGGHDGQTEYLLPQVDTPKSPSGEAAMDSGGDEDQKDYHLETPMSPSGEVAMDSGGDNTKTEYQLPQIVTPAFSFSSEGAMDSGGGDDDQTEYLLTQIDSLTSSPFGEATVDSGGDDDQTEDHLSQIDTSSSSSNSSSEAATDSDDQTVYQISGIDSHTSSFSGDAFLENYNQRYTSDGEELPQIDTATTRSSGEAVPGPYGVFIPKYNQKCTSGGDGDHLQPLFVCPNARISSLTDHVKPSRGGWFSKINASPHFCSTQSSESSLDHDVTYNHHVLPSSVYNNNSHCSVCDGPSVGKDHYYCVTCNNRYHKECVESPLQMKYPSHLKHPFHLYFCSETRPVHCITCRKLASGLVYYSDVFDISMHVLCAQATIPFFLDLPKRHSHTLSLFPRQASLTCNVCGLINKLHLTFVCTRCDFVSHSDCLNIPNIIRISRHHHRISFTYSRQPGKWSCGVCRREVDSEYGAYICNKCSGYVVHIRCALRKDVWDGKDLEGVPEDEEEDVDPFERIAEGVIHHFSHRHHLGFKISRIFDEKKFCQACVLPIYGGGFYACVDQCDFILHETCANAPRKKQHALYPEPLQLALKPDHETTWCRACTRKTNGFIYVYFEGQFYFPLDMRCASVSEPFEYQGHKHPLFLSLEPGEKPRCHVCKSWDYQKVLNCIACDFVICFECATLPYMVRYKHDEHYLTFCHGDDAHDTYWCELCEGRLAIGGEKGFYKCDDCCTTLHINCLLGIDPYLKPGQPLSGQKYGEIHILHNSSLSRPSCIVCHHRCQYPIFFSCDTGGFCSYKCLDDSMYMHGPMVAH